MAINSRTRQQPLHYAVLAKRYNLTCQNYSTFETLKRESLVGMHVGITNHRDSLLINLHTHPKSFKQQIGSKIYISSI